MRILISETSLDSIARSHLKKQTAECGGASLKSYPLGEGESRIKSSGLSLATWDSQGQPGLHETLFQQNHEISEGRATVQ